jgi:hypothetical protein
MIRVEMRGSGRAGVGAKWGAVSVDSENKPAPNVGPICPFCSAHWSEENVHVWDVDSADQCDSGRFEPATYNISISCHSCGREMYRKEGAYAEY